MECPICKLDYQINELYEHLTTRGQHQMNKDIAVYLVYLLEKIQKLEEKSISYFE
jgi:hypothetical protein